MATESLRVSFPAAPDKVSEADRCPTSPGITLLLIFLLLCLRCSARLLSPLSSLGEPLFPLIVVAPGDVVVLPVVIVQHKNIYSQLFYFLSSSCHIIPPMLRGLDYFGVTSSALSFLCSSSGGGAANLCFWLNVKVSDSQLE